MTTNLTTDDAPYVPRQYVSLPVSHGHRLAWLDQNNKITAELFAIESDDPTVFPAIITPAGSPAYGDVIGLRLHFNGTDYDFTHTAVNGDTVASVANALVTMIKSNSAVIAANINISYEQGKIFCNAPWDKMPVISSLVTSSAFRFAIAQSNGLIDLGPVIQMARTSSNGRVPRAGDIIGTQIVIGDMDNNGVQQALSAQYLVCSTKILDPSSASPKAQHRIETAGGGTFQLSKEGAHFTGENMSLNGVSLIPASGIWHPQFFTNNLDGTINLDAQDGYYVAQRISPTVTKIDLHGFLRISSISGSPTGYAVIGGLPFPIRHIVPAGSVADINNIGLPNGYTFMGIGGSGMNQSYLNITASGNGLQAQVVPISGFKPGSSIRFYISYLTD